MVVLTVCILEFVWGLSVNLQVPCLLLVYVEEFLSLGLRCSCPIACEKIIYNHAISMAYWPSNALIADLLQDGFTKETVR